MNHFEVNSIKDCGDYYLINDWWDIPAPPLNIKVDRNKWIRNILEKTFGQKVVIKGSK